MLLPFPEKKKKKFLIFILSSANAYNLDKSKILLFDKKLKIKRHVMWFTLMPAVYQISKIISHFNPIQ